MIISHEHEFIFIKNEKTAGTSVEIALSKYCGASDVLTPISPEDEATREELGHRTAQNYAIPFSQYTRGDWLRFVYTRDRMRFHSHDPATRIRKYTPDRVWDRYFKFCFERNPWDKVVSFYFWRTREMPEDKEWKYREVEDPSIAEFVHSREVTLLRGFELYGIEKEIAVDRVFRFEELEAGLAEAASIVGLPEVPELPRAKASTGRDGRHYRELMGEAERERIAKLFAREIAHFGYAF